MIFPKIPLTQFALNAGKLSFFLVCFLGGEAIAQTLPLRENLINLDSLEGANLLFDSQARRDYLPLSLQFVSQDNLAYCGVASMVMVLNALGIEAPEAPEYRTYRVFTQDNFFNNPKTQAVLPKETVMQQGMTLAELTGFLQSYGLDTNTYHGGEISLAEFRQRIITNLGQPDNFVLVNYLRSEIGQEKGGHISPIAAYNEESDRFLILDVARYKYPPIWVSVEELWHSTNTIDSTSGKTRGFVLISK
ncbi:MULTISPECIES: phytochelatin synthase family protein [Spirulina sp. CCY15215]|uniref:phytochelatin synthase family protein n=1 Tax=Spirulina sp. CCY15215 TaxID=2767591 RepID=UPI00195015C5|nr:phytochelatin synthase family protein [Spirulina major]